MKQSRIIITVLKKELIAASLEDYIKSENKSRLLDKSKWLEDNETYGINTLDKNQSVSGGIGIR